MNDIVKRKGKKGGGGFLVKMRGESEKTLPGSCSGLGQVACEFRSKRKKKKYEKEEVEECECLMWGKARKEALFLSYRLVECIHSIYK